jgi:hypothetical protein
MGAEFRGKGVHVALGPGLFFLFLLVNQGSNLIMSSDGASWKVSCWWPELGRVRQ